MSTACADPLAQLAAALGRLACVKAADVVDQDPVGPRVEITVEERFVEGGRLPRAVALTVYRDSAPWFGEVGLVNVTERAGAVVAIVR